MPHTQLKWPGFTPYNTLIISVDRQEFGIKSKPVEYSGKTFIPKPEAHITVLGSGPGTQLLRLFKNNPRTERQVRQAFEKTDWSYTNTRMRRHLARIKTDHTASNTIEESIIVLIEMEGMAEFYGKLKSLDLINKDHPVPPPHVTLYTRNCDLGIGVHSDHELVAISRECVDELD